MPSFGALCCTHLAAQGARALQGAQAGSGGWAALRSSRAGTLRPMAEVLARLGTWAAAEL